MDNEVSPLAHDPSGALFRREKITRSIAEKLLRDDPRNGSAEGNLNDLPLSVGGHHAPKLIGEELIEVAEHRLALDPLSGHARGETYHGWPAHYVREKRRGVLRRRAKRAR